MVDGYQKITPVAVFYAYAHEDELLRDQLEKHLSLLSRQGLISEWHDRQIEAGAEWAKQIDEHLESASIILLLISPDFLASDYCYNVEMQRALERSSLGEARVIPIILRPVDWHNAPFADLQCLPRDAKPVTQWANQDAAFRNISQELRRILKQIGTAVYSSSRKGNRAFLLKEMRTRWIEGVMLNSLHQEVLIQLGLHEQPGAVANPWSLIVRETNLPERPLAVRTHIHEVYDRADVQVLILGEPGSGKTTLLLQLARTLLTRASEDENHPMPVIFNLSSWSIKRLPLADWLIEELHDKYSIPSTIAQTWVMSEQIIPLLDGLDEVKEEQRTVRVSSINIYRQAHHLIPLVICCRKTEYNTLPIHVELQTAVIIQPLPLRDVDWYCEQIGEPVIALRQALHQVKDLQELTTTPLMLSILVLAYREAPSTDLLDVSSLEQLRQRIFARYIERMLTRRGTSAYYTKEQTLRWLSWLAKQLQRRSLTEFYPGYLSSQWLPTPQTRYIYNAVTVLLAELLFGTPLGLLSGLLARLLAGRLAGLLIGLIVGLFAGLFFGLNEYAPSEVIQWKWVRVQNTASSLLLIGLLVGLLTWLIFGLLGGLLFGQPIGLLVGLLDGLLTALLTGLLGGLRDHQSNEVIRWEWTRVQKHVFFLTLAGLLVGLLGWLIFGLLFGLVAGLFSGLLAALAVGFFPGQRDPYELSALDYYMERSRDNDIRFGLRTGLFTGLPMGLFAGLLVTLLVVLLIWLLFGLGAILHQQKLLIFLRCLGAIPRNYVQFLDYAAERILMRKVGRGYIFIHRLLLEYFGSLNPLTGAPQGAEHRQPLVP